MNDQTNVSEIDGAPLAPVHAPHANMNDACDDMLKRANNKLQSAKSKKSKTGASSSAPVKRVQIDCDALGARKKISRARAINDVLMSADKALTVSEIESKARASKMGREYAHINGREIGAVAAHLAHLLLNECVEHVGGAWRVVSKLRKKQKQSADDAPAAQ